VPAPLTRSFLTRLVALPLCLFGSLATAQVPAVMYHAHPNLGYDQNNFRDHMDFLVDNGYNTIDMDEFYDWYANEGILPLRPIVITVDDNYVLGYTEMYPIFAERGIVATNYTHTQGIGIGAPKASWVQVNEMDAAGVFLIESHSRTHPTLDTVSSTQLTSEVHGSQADIIANVNGKITRHFCYPYGRYNEAVIDELIAAGYVTGLTTIRGLNYRDTPPYELRRWHGDSKNLTQFLTEIQHAQLPPPPPGEGWILDDAEPHALYDNTSWLPTASVPGYFHTGYRVRAAGGPEASSLRWAAHLPQTGRMRVHARWTENANRASNAEYLIHTASGIVSVVVDQRINGAQWNDLGIHEFAEGEPVQIWLGGPSDGYIVADAIWFEPVPAPEASDHFAFY
jgi:peptidoglycan/xylan/chitin deacetylase (PgdA/CDA1 family)